MVRSDAVAADDHGVGGAARHGPLRLSVLEPSKVRNQHITLLAGIAAAGAALPVTLRGAFTAHASLLHELPTAVTAAWGCNTVPVMNPERRRLVRKSLLEAAVVCWRVFRLRRDELLLVTCILPPALIALELFKRFFPRRHVVVMIHGEIEGVFEVDRQHPGSFGYYVRKWLGLRRRNSTLQLAVIDDFIADELIASFGDRIRREDVFVVPHPITALSDIGPVAAMPRICFIGFRTGFKGYPVFERLAAQVSGATFVAIGAGQEEMVPGGTTRQLAGTADYMAAIAACDVAVFPYVGGYRASLSAAALDAISAGLHLVATRRGCFVSLHDTLGPDYVTLVDDEHAAQALLSDRVWMAARRADRTGRIAAISSSKYSIPGLTRALVRLMERQDDAPVVVGPDEVAI